MESMARPTFADDGGGGGALLDGGIDLNMKEGMAEYVVIAAVVMVIQCHSPHYDMVTYWHFKSPMWTIYTVLQLI